MRRCIPLASEDKLFSIPPFFGRLGERRAFAAVAVAVAVWLVPLDVSGQHFYAGLHYGLERPSKAEPGNRDCSAVRAEPRDGCEAVGSLTRFRMFDDLTAAPAVGPVFESPTLQTARIEWITGRGAKFAFEDPHDSSKPEKRRSLSRFGIDGSWTEGSALRSSFVPWRCCL